MTATLTPDDYSTAEMETRFGLTEVEVQAAFATAGKPGPWDFSVFGAVWVGGRFTSATSVTVRARSADGSHDYCMACVTPGGDTVVANDEADGTPCTVGGDCDAALVLDGAGLWTCVFAATPSATTNVDPYGTLEVSAE